ncbi:MAG: DUF3592 domain-containing protein [Firmicutes bacterium]|nr:DUF3592 domain-containing protein [Bacillota bacterium]
MGRKAEKIWERLKCGDVPKYFIIIIVGAFTFLFGVESLVDAAMNRNEWERFKKDAIRTEATVTSVSVRSMPRSGQRTYVYVKYKDSTGEEHKGSLENQIKGAKKGDVVPLYYNKNAPKNFMVDPGEMNERYIKYGTALTIIGVAVIIAGIKTRHLW